MQIVFWICLLIQEALLQFPDHLDLEKVDELTLHNEKYRVLQPTVHHITDYFKEYMLRTNEKQPGDNERIFLDDNGFRHYWSKLNVLSRKHDKDVRTDEVVETTTDENNKKRYFVTTTLFCPFLGIIKHRVLIDHALDEPLPPTTPEPEVP